ncbi:hypothetical protein ANAEL_01364 [Anaerolineales bacterium]|nr:hypothetical protein ANAEL_01364 [Anaerolineales bacterium]
MSKTFVAARTQGYGGGEQRFKKRGNQNQSTCMVRFIIEAKKFGFLRRAVVNPAYAYRTWQKFCAVPVQ